MSSVKFSLSPAIPSFPPVTRIRRGLLLDMSSLRTGKSSSYPRSDLVGRRRSTLARCHRGRLLPERREEIDGRVARARARIATADLAYRVA